MLTDRAVAGTQQYLCQKRACPFPLLPSFIEAEPRLLLHNNDQLNYLRKSFPLALDLMILYQCMT